MDDVAVRLGITLVAAKSRLMRARAELKQRLERQFGSSGRTIVPA
jgi:DNA-directed RNA polymerase specialized sigma24 family protein